MSYVTEAQQIEQIKSWWKQYGLAIGLGILIVVIGHLSWRYWQHGREFKLQHASIRYEQLLTSVANRNTGAAAVQAERLIKRYPHTPYAQLAALFLARQDVYAGQLASAETRLTWIMQHGDSPALRQVARIRAARVLLAERQAQAALNLLQKSDDKSYGAATDEVTGDILLALGKPDAARAAYANALKALPGLEINRPILQMKLDDLAPTVSARGAI